MSEVSCVRRYRLGFDSDGVAHVPDEPEKAFTEAMCASVFSDEPISVKVEERTFDEGVTCLRCIAFHLHKLWIVLAGTLIRVNDEAYARGDTVYYDGRASTVVELDNGEYGQRLSLRTPSGSIILTTPGLDPRFKAR